MIGRLTGRLMAADQLPAILPLVQILNPDVDEGSAILGFHFQKKLDAE